jgi:diguanylate cyclase
LDHFKRINDSFGHLAGDEVLKSLGLFLLQRLRTIDLVGRYGGEGIAMILPDIKALQALHLVNELLEPFSTLKFTHRANEFFVTFSGGITEFP